MINFLTSDAFITLVAVPFLILVARIIDVTLGTIRLIFVYKSEKLLATAVGFFEALIWLLAITRIMSNLTNIYAYFAYAAGFAAGNYIGISLEKKILVGKVIVRLTTQKNAKSLVKELKAKRYTFTCVGVDSPNGEVKSIHVIINKKDMQKLINFIIKYDKNSFYTVEEAKIVSEKGALLEPTPQKVDVEVKK